MIVDYETLESEHKLDPALTLKDLGIEEEEEVVEEEQGQD